MASLCAGDLPQAVSRYDDGLAAVPATASHGPVRALLLAALATALSLAGDAARVTACDRDLAALTAAGGDLIHRWYLACSLSALGLVAWHQGDLDRAAGLQQQSLLLRDGLGDRSGVTYCLETLAWTAASGRQHERAAVLLGASDRLRRSMALTLDGQRHLSGYHRDCERQACQGLGEAAFEAACDRGMRLSPQDAVGYALRQSTSPDEPPAPPSAAPEPPAPPLTRRETQVARLIAEGYSNKEIAARLVIAQRTAEGHVEHILTKLGFTSRAQIAAWITAAQPDH